MKYARGTVEAIGWAVVIGMAVYVGGIQLKCWR